MKRFITLFLISALMLSCGSKSSKSTQQEEIYSSKKIITAGGTITEIVFALGHGDEIIATDRTSTYPASMQSLPSIGYRNQIQAEGILSLGPDMILVEEGYLNDDVLFQLQNSGKEVHVFEKPLDKSSSISLIESVGQLFKEEENSKKLVGNLEQDFSRLETLKTKDKRNPEVIFIMSRGPETVFLAGKETFADAIIQLAGGKKSPVDFEGMKPLTPEALAAINPEYILLFESGWKASGGKDGLKAIQGITETEAWKKDQLIAMDGHYLSGFGPRLGKAAIELFEKTHP
ncbi:ABC transporter substrate-binding protein [Echinicola sp. CAU 1574]|uniref:ABC transporter substrate-binding protein n=1 Tax=Echinicola arenosa TaxID=2774144 RepID=A0ABR9APW6_9BACT|nr:ABC transporter substrate-binding protein [Echinicola arenosa]MBD8490614.1 ABC transporter substrate-binding protein [Echinicola arenosa]